MEEPRLRAPVLPELPDARPPEQIEAPSEQVSPIDQRRYEKHALRHELTGDDTVRLSVQNNGTQLNRYRTLNFLSPLNATEDATNKRINVAGISGGARAYHNAAQATTSSTFLVLAFNSERYDTESIHDTATNNSRLTCRTAGKYLIVANVRFETSSAGDRHVELYLNGATTIGLQAVRARAAFQTVLQVTTIYDLAVNDYVEVRVWQDSGGALNVETAGNYSPEFAMQRIG